MMLVDSHCHLDQLDLTPYNGSLDEVIKHAKNLGVKYFLSVGLTLAQSRAVIKIAETYPEISASVGIHPTEEIEETKEKSDTAWLEKTLVDLASHSKVIALGETGLDFYRASDEETKKNQTEKFRAHIRAAKKLNKPLIIHTRQARNETIQILKEENAQETGGVMHCFTESLEMAKAAIELNFYISLSGIITFKNALELQTLAQQIPLERLLIETDAPYLAPMPYRGKSNLPGYVRYTAEKIAALRQAPLETIASVTTKNFFDLFKLADRSVYDVDKLAG